MSRIAAPVGDVTMPITRGYARQRPLAGSVEEPLRLEPPLELLEGELERADALGLEQLHDQLVLPARGVDVEAAEGQHLHAVLGLEAHRRPRPRKSTARSCAVSSFSVK